MDSAFPSVTLALKEPILMDKLVSQLPHAQTVRSGIKLSLSVSALWTLFGTEIGASVVAVDSTSMGLAYASAHWAYSGMAQNVLQLTVPAALACRIAIGLEENANACLDLYQKGNHASAMDYPQRVIAIAATSNPTHNGALDYVNANKDTMKSKVSVSKMCPINLLCLPILSAMLPPTLIVKLRHAFLALTGVFLALHATLVLSAGQSTTTILSASSARKYVETAKDLL